ncbi:DUF3597 domain-containing protein [Candidatus Villigracilis saccharophilus]|jgi:hypothetical protein|uniref:DUF3597 domain-containing protein n=1 Tax=Candidatus Villigracilis saccharophilus TaxID=3140684 RepID=UPI003134BCBA|nr:DUF3597 domain-containing protein [Anaerolineales bacterium]
MGFFSKILEKLGIKKNEPAAEPVQVAAPAKPAAPVKQAPPAVAAKPATVASVARPAGMKAEKNDLDSLKTIEPVKAPVPVAISEVDVVKQLEELSVGKGLNWKVSIVDLLKLLDIDSSREARNELATELGCPADLMHDSAKMNVWLHKEVLKKIAENGGNIPQSLLD